MPATMPSMLALLILPEEMEEWTKWTPDELMIKGKMFWLSLQNQEVSDNKDNVTVKIPKENILNADTIENLIKKAAEEGFYDIFCKFCGYDIEIKSSGCDKISIRNKLGAIPNQKEMILKFFNTKRGFV